MSADDLFPPEVLAELERQRHAERMSAIRKQAAIRHALWVDALLWQKPTAP